MKPATVFALVPVVLLLGACMRSATLTVENQSSVELTGVVAMGNGFKLELGSIPAGGRRQVSVRPQGETSLQLEFDAQGRHHVTKPDHYFEANSFYRVTAVVRPDFTVTVQ